MKENYHLNNEDLQILSYVTKMPSNYRNWKGYIFALSWDIVVFVPEE